MLQKHKLINYIRPTDTRKPLGIFLIVILIIGNNKTIAINNKHSGVPKYVTTKV